ncbi:MAG: exopolyphosphatase [Desulfuromonadaceae bacterium]|nr:exopolyphosphatase [Desulfuromonadaceae bacterium]
MRCAAIDLGTNTARLLIGDYDSSHLATLCVEREIVRLGGGFTDEQGLSENAQLRALGCLKRFSGIMKEFGVQRVTASATSAVRDAVNGRIFVERVFIETGIRLTVIDGKLEGILTLKGVISGLNAIHDSMVVIDVGGGSTEITISEHGNILYDVSLPLGVVRLTEGFGTPEAMSERIAAILGDLHASVISAGVCIKPDAVMIATAGTATTLAAIKMEMVDYDYRKVNNLLMSRVEIAEVYDRLIVLNREERTLIPGLEAGREDLIIAGILIILHFMDLLGFTWLKVSDYGLLEGLALSGDDL